MKSSDKREAILQASLDSFARQGLQRTTLGGIAQAAGIPRGTVYEYYRGKEEILLDLLDHRLSLAEEDIARLHAMADEDPQAALRRLTTTMIRFKTGQDRRFGTVRQELLLDGLADPAKESKLMERFHRIQRRDWELIVHILCAEARRKGHDRGSAGLKAYLLLVLYTMLEDATYYFSPGQLERFLRLFQQYVLILMES